MSQTTAPAAAYKVVATYVKKGRHSPAFPTIPGWTFVGLNKATPEGEKEATYTGEGIGLATIVETLYTFLQAAAEKGEVRSAFTVKLFQHVEMEAKQGSAAEPVAQPVPAKKKSWLSFF